MCLSAANFGDGEFAVSNDFEDRSGPREVRGALPAGDRTTATPGGLIGLIRSFRFRDAVIAGRIIEMDLEHFLHQAVVVLGAAVVVLLASHRLRVPPLVGLLLTGPGARVPREQL